MSLPPHRSLCLLSQSECEEKVVTYDHIGPNVCMGDHKVMGLGWA